MLGAFSAFPDVMFSERSDRGLFLAGFACRMPSLIPTAAVPGRFCPLENPAFVAFGRSTPPNRSRANTLSLNPFKAPHA
jgi:hypothetical protein